MFNEIKDIIEQSDVEDQRIQNLDRLEALSKIDIDHFLENLIIADANTILKIKAFQLLLSRNKNLSEKCLEWNLKHMDNAEFELRAYKILKGYRQADLLALFERKYEDIALSSRLDDLMILIKILSYIKAGSKTIRELYQIITDYQEKNTILTQLLSLIDTEEIHDKLKSDIEVFLGIPWNEILFLNEVKEKIGDYIWETDKLFYPYFHYKITEPEVEKSKCCDKLDEMEFWPGEDIRETFTPPEFFPQCVYYKRSGHIIGLKISNNPLEELPQTLFSLKELRFLNLSRNRLTSLPKELLQLKKLRYLDFSWNNIGEVPDFLKKLHYLREVRLHSNPIRAFPDWFYNFLIKSCGWKYIQRRIHRDEVPALCAFECLRGEVIESYLEKEYLEDITLEEINELDDMDDMEGRSYILNAKGRIRSLYICQNDPLSPYKEAYDVLLPFIPKNITQLKELECLNLWKNNLQEVPAFLRQLKKLRILNIRENPILQYPDWLLKIESLKKGIIL